MSSKLLSPFLLLTLRLPPQLCAMSLLVAALVVNPSSVTTSLSLLRAPVLRQSCYYSDLFFRTWALKLIVKFGKQSLERVVAPKVLHVIVILGCVKNSSPSPAGIMLATWTVKIEEGEAPYSWLIHRVNNHDHLPSWLSGERSWVKHFNLPAAALETALGTALKCLQVSTSAQDLVENKDSGGNFVYRGGVHFRKFSSPFHLEFESHKETKIHPQLSCVIHAIG
ncbi:hypothetical protein DFH05DRAFT_1458327 [Lentinula detonsa]|uniref:Uncharacterized protein n=1 Tax=Lentinula detonsa TaxID=2804962 RepID=A0A9W8P6U4_9AGAR|nr:hypothetical protein DFH05DRAFT_1458327 [Lentinula detonsa]